MIFCALRYQRLALMCACLVGLSSLPAQSQGLRSAPRTGSQPALIGLPAPSPAAGSTGQRFLDFIVAVVNSEPITNHDVNLELQRVLLQFEQMRRPRPDPASLQRDVLERLINEKTQLQLAKQTGIRIEQTLVDQAEQNIALQNKIDVAELRRRVAAEGTSVQKFQTQLRDQLTLTRLRERDVEPRVRISDLEVEQYIKEQTDKPVDPASQQINIAQILVAVSESATPGQVEALQAKARQVLERARAGEDFAQLARELSDAPDRVNGGQLGLRAFDRYPPLFLEATQNLLTGGVSELVRSGAGFHVLKVIEKRQSEASGLPPSTVTQSRARHILLRPSAQLSEAAALARLNDYRRRIQRGQSDFAALARENSQDGSAPQGGDLGWASPGQFVPEFEAVMNRLVPGQISEPLISRFGVHLIQLMERRTAALSAREQREMVRSMLREKKLDEAFVTWAQEVRGRAYVELRDPPELEN
jgi:peptidyl-prolyl cis-trans isomerase SurA